jgi:hypothetical protein
VARPSRRTAAAGELRWAVWPARGRPLATAVLLAGAIVLGVLITQGAKDPVLGLAAPLFVLASLGSFLLPTEYRLSKDAVEIRSLGVARMRPWNEVRRVVDEGTAVRLSPFESKSWLDPYRSIRLLYGGNRDQVLAFIQARLQAVEAKAGPTAGSDRPDSGG